MRINPDNNINRLNLRKTRKGSSPPSANKSNGDLLALVQVQSMVDNLMSIPEVREEVVELGRRLARDPDYPQEHIVDEVSRILAKAINR